MPPMYQNGFLCRHQNWRIVLRELRWIVLHKIQLVVPDTRFLAVSHDAMHRLMQAAFEVIHRRPYFVKHFPQND